MKRNALSIFFILLLTTALAALAQSPTTSAMGGSETKAPYGATLDHPNPGSTQGAPGQPANSNNMNQAQTPATDANTAATPSTSSTNSDTATTPSTSSTSSSDNNATTNTTSSQQSLPRTASDFPLLAVIGLMALGGALTVRSIAKRA